MGINDLLREVTETGGVVATVLNCGVLSGASLANICRGNVTTSYGTRARSPDISSTQSYSLLGSIFNWTLGSRERQSDSNRKRH